MTLYVVIVGVDCVGDKSHETVACKYCKAYSHSGGARQLRHVEPSLAVVKCLASSLARHLTGG